LRGIVGLSGALPPRTGQYTGVASGSQFEVTGLDSESDWAYMGVRLTTDRGQPLSVYANYDSQFGRHLQLLTASIGIVLSR
jgi:uncharacterized protein with beta-barrel porin domain